MDTHELKELASLELELSMTSNVDKCNLRTLEQYNSDIEEMQLTKHKLLIKQYNNKLIGIFMIAVLIIFFEVQLYFLIPLLLCIGIHFLLRFKIEKLIFNIKSDLYHLSYSDIIYNNWIDDINSNGFFIHWVDRDTLIKRNINNYYIDNYSKFE